MDLLNFKSIQDFKTKYEPYENDNLRITFVGKIRKKTVRWINFWPYEHYIQQFTGAVEKVGEAKMVCDGKKKFNDM